MIQPRHVTHAVLAACVVAVGNACIDANAAERAAGAVRLDAVATAAGDSVRLVARWTPVAVLDNLGPIDGYRLTVTRTAPSAFPTAQVFTFAATALQGSVSVPTGLSPAIGTVSGQGCLVALRRGLPSPTPRCAAWTVTLADQAPPAVPTLTFDSVVVSSLPVTDSVTLLVQVSGSRLRALVASGACSTAGTACLAALQANATRDTLRPGCGRMVRTTTRKYYGVADPDTLAPVWLDCGAVAVAAGGTRQVAINALQSLGFTYR